MKDEEFTYECIQLLIKKGRIENIEHLADRDYCKRRFDMNYPVLQKVSPMGTIDSSMFTDHAGNRRYYPLPIQYNGKHYIPCNDWYYGTHRDTRTDFVEWVLT
jgi:hypothetical protein